MANLRKNVVGQKYGRLSVLHYANLPENSMTASGKRIRNKYVLCQCDCGKTVSVRVDHIRAGKTRSCGCLAQEFHFVEQQHRAALLTYSTALSADARIVATQTPLVPQPSQQEQRHDLPAGQYAQMLVEQNGVCAICLEPPTTKPLCVDHCHATGLVRGLLCSGCNTAIGMMKENPKALGMAIVYIVKNLTSKDPVRG